MIDYTPYLRYVLRERKLSPHALARMAGLSPSTISRYLKEGEEKSDLSTRTIDKIARSTGLSPAPFIDGAPYPDTMSKFRGKFDQLRDQSIESNNSSITDGTISFAEFRVCPGVWIDEGLRDFRSEPNYFLPTFKPTDEKFYAEVSGNSVNQIAQDGDMLYCQRIFDNTYTPLLAIGGLAIVKRVLAISSLVEYSAMHLSRERDGVRFYYKSDDLKFRNTSIHFSIEESNEFSIIGVALSVVRPLIRSIPLDPDSD